jgi:hypothetical protein
MAGVATNIAERIASPEMKITMPGVVMFVAVVLLCLQVGDAASSNVRRLGGVGRVSCLSPPEILSIDYLGLIANQPTFSVTWDGEGGSGQAGVVVDSTFSAFLFGFASPPDEPHFVFADPHMNTGTLPYAPGTAHTAVVTVRNECGTTVSAPYQFVMPGGPPSVVPPPKQPYLVKFAELHWCVNFGDARCATLESSVHEVSLPVKTPLTMVCWETGSAYTGTYRSTKWFYVMGGGREGFVHSSFVRDQVAVSNCSTIPWLLATDWAIAHLGTTAPTKDERRDIDKSMTAWSGYCWAFVWGAWDLGAKRALLLGTAVSVGSRYPLQQGVPPRGAAVFWSLPKGLGHAAISLGNGVLVTTVGLGPPGPSYPVTHLTLGDESGLKYMGWYRPT